MMDKKTSQVVDFYLLILKYFTELLALLGLGRQNTLVRLAAAQPACICEAKSLLLILRVKCL